MTQVAPKARIAFGRAFAFEVLKVGIAWHRMGKQVTPSTPPSRQGECCW